MTDRYPDLEKFYRLCGRPGICAYCGYGATEIDHTVPRHHVNEHRRAYLNHWFPKVPACAECNGWLNGRIIATFSERKRLVAVKLRKKYKSALLAQAWGDDEIDELGRGLRSKIEKAKKVGRLSDRRIAYADFPPTHGIPDDLFGNRKAVTPQASNEEAVAA